MNKLQFPLIVISLLALSVSACGSAQTNVLVPMATSTFVPPTSIPKIPTFIPIILIQDENYSRQTPIISKASNQLENNYIGNEGGGYEYGGYGHSEYIIDPGYKWVRISSNTDFLNWQRAEIAPGIFDVPPKVDSVVSYYDDNGVTVLLNLGVGDGENRPDTTRFNGESEIEHYLEYVRYMVEHFKGRIQYYEIWNEPNIPASDAPWGQIAFNDYIRLVKQVAPIIRKIDPEAKIVVGVVSGVWRFDFPGYGEWARHTFDIEYLKALASSDIMPLVDGISWHPFYCTRADDPYYQEYPQIVNEIKQEAWDHGFNGEFIAEEISWRTPDVETNSDLQPFSEMIITKYFLRTVVVHRGLGIMVGISMGESASSQGIPSRDRAIPTLNTIMAGVIPTNEQIILQIENDLSLDIEYYSFSLSNGDKTIAIWTDGLPIEEDPGVIMDITLKNIGATTVSAADVLYGVQQKLIWQEENGDIHIHNLRIRDYPLFILLSK